MLGTMSVLLILLLLQHSQNGDMNALQVKVDELIRLSDGASNYLIAAERREANELEALVRDRREDA
jgi:low affinity Fe/Cu permease